MVVRNQLKHRLAGADIVSGGHKTFLYHSGNGGDHAGPCKVVLRLFQLRPRRPGRFLHGDPLRLRMVQRGCGDKFVIDKLPVSGDKPGLRLRLGLLPYQICFCRGNGRLHVRGIQPGHNRAPGTWSPAST